MLDKMNYFLNRLGKIIFGVVGVIIVAYFIVKYIVG